MDPDPQYCRWIWSTRLQMDLIHKTWYGSGSATLDPDKNPRYCRWIRMRNTGYESGSATAAYVMPSWIHDHCGADNEKKWRNYMSKNSSPNWYIFIIRDICIVLSKINNFPPTTSFYSHGDCCTVCPVKINTLKKRVVTLSKSKIILIPQYICVKPHY